MPKSFKNLCYALIAFGFLFITPLYAQDEDPPELNWAMAQKFLDDVVYRYIYPLAGLVCFIFLLKGGYMWMMSEGDPDKVKQAQGTLTWSVIGLVIVIVSRLLMDVILEAIA